MSIRISLYDFFSYTIPGIIYLIIIGFWANAFGLVNVDIKTINSLSVSSALIIVGAGYIIGSLMDLLSYRWMRLFYRRNIDEAKAAFDEFQSRTPWLALEFKHTDWGVLFAAIKGKSLEAAAEVEQYNVAAIMLRNISLSLIISSVSCLIFLFVFKAYILNLSLGIIFFILSIVALRRSDIRRRWFYLGIYEAFVANFLLEGKLGIKNQPDLGTNTPGVTTSTSSEDMSKTMKDPNNLS
jgi:hypothetical protein